MTVASEIVTRTYMGNGLVRNWPIPFELPADGAQYVQVYITAPGSAPVLLASGYSVDLAAMSVKYPISGDPLANGYKITVRRQLPYTQETDLNSQGPFDPETIEKTFDRNVMQIQQLAEEVDRAVKVPIGSLENSDDLWENIKAQVSTATAAANSAVGAASKAENEADNAKTSATAAGNSAQAASDILKSVQDAGTEAIDGISDAVMAGKAEIGAELDNKVNTAAASATDAQVSAEAAAGSAVTAAQYSKGLEFNWQGTELGVRREGGAGFEYVDLQGPAGKEGADGKDGVDGEVTLVMLEEKLAALSTGDESANAPTEKVQHLGLVGTSSADYDLTIDAANGNIVTLTACPAYGLLNLHLKASADVPSCRVLTLIITNGGNIMLGWWDENWLHPVKWSAGVAPALSASGTDVVTLLTTDNGASWLGMLSGGAFA